MSERPAVRSESRSVPSMLTAVPWVVVLLGVVLLTILLVLALLSFRGPEHQSAPASAPTLYLPTLPADTVSASPTDEPLSDEAEATPSPSSGSPSPRARASTATARPSDRPSDRPASVPSGELTARYQVTDNDRGSFEARLTVANDSGGDRNWRVELLFTGDIRSIRVSSTSKVAVSSEGNGWYALRGTRSLDPGESATVELTFGRTGSWDRPDQCTVNGADCVIG